MMLNFFGQPIQRIPNKEGKIFLTFDDGPTDLTSSVLDTLEKRNAKATFFVIAEKARANRDIIQKIISQGHAIGDHSMDHNYFHFFSGERYLANWVDASQKLLEDIIGQKPVGFRSPAGVRTPPLERALERLKVPWIHWSHRFYDTQLEFKASRYAKKLLTVESGDIILLHDRQKKKFEKSFLKTLDSYIQGLQDKNFDFCRMETGDYNL